MTAARPIPTTGWTYEEAFSRNLGLISRAEQQRLRRARIAIAGVGGVGGGHALTLARQGIGGFRLADPDTFGVANFNRQAGARLSSLGRNKAAEVKEQLLDINPEASVDALEAALDESNIAAFLDGVDVVVDGLDFFAIEARRLLHREARRRGLWVLTAGPLGFSVASLAFDPRGMSFDEYLSLEPGMSREDQLIAFAVALAPAATQVRYTDYSQIRVADGVAPSAGLACALCNAVVAVETIALLLGRRKPRAVPRYAQFDPYTQAWKTGRLWLANRGPLQRLKRAVLRHQLEKMGVVAAPAPRAATSAAPVRDPVDAVLEAGNRAPSADNSQPWALSRHGRRVQISLAGAGTAFADFGRFASLISAGAVLENMTQAATAHGLECVVTELPAAQGSDVVAGATLVPADVRESPLAKAVARRCTNRRLYARRPLDPGVLPRLEQALADFPRARLHVIADPSGLSRLARLAYRVDRVRAELQPVHEQFHAKLRWSDAELERLHDGFPVDTLMVGAVGKAFLRVTRPWSVMSAVNQVGGWRGVAAFAGLGFHFASAALLVTTADDSPADLVMGGRAMQRLWLTLTSEGLAAQPMMSLPLFHMRWRVEGARSFAPAHGPLLQASFKEYQACFPTADLARNGQVALFRVGYAPPPPVQTPRRPLSSSPQSEVQP